MTAQRLELLLIAFLSLGWALVAPASHRLPLAEAMGMSAALLLGQGLVRDLVRLARRRKETAAARRIVCLCAESSVGLTLVVLAFAALFLGVDQPVVVSHGALQWAPALILGAGFVMKDYVVTVRRETDHASVIVL